MTDFPTGGAPMGEPTSDDRTMSMLAHLGGILLGFIPSLVIMLTKGKESAFVKDESTEALNFQITVAIAYAVSAVLMCVLIGFFTFFLVWIANIIFCIMGGMAANKGQHYKYPATLRLIK